MKIKIGKEKEFEQFVEINSQDFYSLGIVNYVKRWAELMEEEIEKGKNVFEIAEQTSYIADTDGITLWMYGTAVMVLSQVWEYGEDLKKWHNGQYDYNGDSVVSPAIWVLKSEDKDADNN